MDALGIEANVNSLSYFHRFAAGKLIGKRAWGGLVGIFEVPELMDGGHVTAPNAAVWNLDCQFDVENRCVPSDIEAEMDPEAVREGHDPQLETAVDGNGGAEVTPCATAHAPPASKLSSQGGCEQIASVGSQVSSQAGRGGNDPRPRAAFFRVHFCFDIFGTISHARGAHPSA